MEAPSKLIIVIVFFFFLGNYYLNQKTGQKLEFLWNAVLNYLDDSCDLRVKSLTEKDKADFEKWINS